MSEEKIITMPSNENHKEGTRRLHAFLTNEVSKSKLAEFVGWEKKDLDKISHADLVILAFLRKTPQDMIDNFEIPNVRVCTKCGEPMVVGVYADGNYFCSDECLDKGLGIDKYLELSDDEDGEIETEYYYTEWE